MHGIGNALFEWMGYDADAQPVTTTLADYLLPTAADISNIEVHLVEYPSPKNPLGVKGLGESGTVPAAAAVISGVEDALREFDVRIAQAPISPAQIRSLIRGARAASGDTSPL